MFMKFVRLFSYNSKKITSFFSNLTLKFNKPGKLQIVHLMRSKYSLTIVWLNLKNLVKKYFKQLYSLILLCYSQYFKKLNWRPLFKKTSYFGLYRSMRNRSIIEEYNKK